MTGREPHKDGASPSAEACREAAAYSARHRGVGLLILRDGHMLWEDYPAGGGADRAHEIASGTKSLVGLMAVLAAADGLLALDEPVVRTIPEWAGDERKSRITIRELLQLVSGIEAGGKPGKVPGYEDALGTPAVAEPGRRFSYGAAPFQVFGEVLRRKLGAICPDPGSYLQGRLLDRIGVEVARWRRGPDGYPNLTAGVSLTARSWGRVGEWIVCEGRWDGRQLLPAEVLDECWRASDENPAYGLGWWLNASLGDVDAQRVLARHKTLGLEDLWADPAIPRDLVYAAGAGKQRLYISRQERLVVVRQARGVTEALARGEQGGYSDRAFLGCLFAWGAP